MEKGMQDKVVTKKERTIVQKHRKNFETLLRAVKNNDVCIMDCILKKSCDNCGCGTTEHVAVICAVVIQEDGTINMTPFAMFFNDNPYELLIPPGEYES